MWRDILHLLWYFFSHYMELFLASLNWSYAMLCWRPEMFFEALFSSLGTATNNLSPLCITEQILQPLSKFFTLGTLEISSKSTHRCTFSYQTSQIFGSHSKLVLIYSLFILPEYRVCISISKVHTHTQMNVREIVMLSGINSFNQKYFIVQLICFDFCFKNTDHVLGFVWSWCHRSLIFTSHIVIN